MEKWYHARDTFIGANGRKRDIILGKSLLEEIVATKGANHQEANWILTKFCCIDFVSRISQSPASDPAWKIHGARGLFYAGAICRYPPFILEAAKMGHVPAQGIYAEMIRTMDVEGDHLKWATLSANKGDKQGLYELYHITGKMKHLEAAAAQGCVDALMEKFYRAKNQRERLRYAMLVDPFLADDAPSMIAIAVGYIMLMYEKNGQGADDAFFAGRVVKRRINVLKSTVWGRKCEAGSDFLYCARAEALYDVWSGLTMDACDAWVVCAKRLEARGLQSLCKDVRVMISKMIWDMRGPPVESHSDSTTKKIKNS